MRSTGYAVPTVYITMVGCDWCTSILLVPARSCSLKWLHVHRETNDNTLIVIVSTTMNNYMNLFLESLNHWTACKLIHFAMIHKSITQTTYHLLDFLTKLMIWRRNKQWNLIAGDLQILNQLPTNHSLPGVPVFLLYIWYCESSFRFFHKNLF